MPSQVDFAIAVGLFITFIAVLLLYLTGYMSSFTGLISTSELRTAAYNFFNTLFGGKGVPESWEKYNRTPVVAGLVTDLIKVPVTVSEEYGRSFTNLLVPVENLKLENHVWNSTVRIYDGDGNEVKYDFDEQYFDSDENIREMSISFLTNLTAGQTKKFFIYGSQDKAIAFKNYTVNGWWNSSYRYRKPIVLVENLGQNRNNELTGKHIVFDKDCEYRVVDSNIRVIDDNNQSIPYSLNNTVYCAGSYLKEADVWFNTTITVNSHTAYWVYYNPLITIFEDGFESGDFSAWTLTSGSPQIVLSPVHHGTYAMKSSFTSSGEIFANKELNTGYSTIFIRVYWLTSSLPSLDDHVLTIFRVRGIGTQYIADVQYKQKVGGGYEWRIWNRVNGLYYTYDETINPNQWYSLELKVVISQTNGELRLWRNGEEIITKTGINTGLNNAQNLDVGFSNNKNVILDLFNDDVIVADRYVGL